jgi:predicted alpha/beta-hydrolase family hydrolase
MTAMATAFAESGIAALRIDLPFRHARRAGPPHPSTAARDREGLLEAVRYLRSFGPVYLAGHSYGGRQATMLAAEGPDVTPALLLLSYPLHPPAKPDRPRTAHFPDLRTPALFVHGARDPFGSPDEMREALKLIPGRTALQIVEGAAHELKPVISKPKEFVELFLKFYLPGRSAT